MVIHQYKIDEKNGTSRRHFLKLAGITTLGIPFVSFNYFKNDSIAIISDPDDAIAASAPSVWAAGELEHSLVSQGIIVNRYNKLADAKKASFIIVVAGGASGIAVNLLKIAGVKIPQVSEALGLIPVKQDGKQLLLTYGQDERGLVYALLELADRVLNSEQPLIALNVQKPIIEQPANSIRSLNRMFVSDVEDKPWFNDREMWPQYLTMLATQRFNRFNLSFGIGYDFLQKVTDAYFLFAYPFLLSVPGYNVRVPQLPDAERDSNLAMLKFISEQTVARGLQFQLGIWMHGYEWLNTTNANYTVEGLTKESHAAYCRDALRLLLQTCPAISGITFRVHGESGVNEGSYQFWGTIFDGVKTCGRKVEIDMHAKGLDQQMIDTALSTGMPVVLSPKYWAEHMGMPYHQADIRSLEIPNTKQKSSGLMNLSSGSRSFLRYGYGDLLKENRPYKILYRIWPGTQRLLLWGDPVTAAAHSRAFSFCGSDGVELMEPLSFKGRRGSGIPGDRCGYLDDFYKPRWDWQKYLYTLRIFGRMTYNPDTTSDTWQRLLRKQFGASAAKATDAALANVSRILPIITTAHGASAGNNMYWPEMYTNQPITDAHLKNTYTDTPSPKTFGNVTPLDPQLFLGINDFVKEYLSGQRSGKYTPLDVAQWLEDYSAEGAKYLAEAKLVHKNNKPEYCRMVTDVSIQIGLGRFFASKFRTGVLFAIYEQSGDYTALEEALKTYHKAKNYWVGLAETGKKVYQTDISVGELPWLRGYWLDRIPAMEEDVANMTKILEAFKVNNTNVISSAKNAIQEALERPKRLNISCRHNQPKSFKKGQPVNVEFAFDSSPQSAILYYRHVNHAERYQKINLVLQGNLGRAGIPGDYTNSPYSLAYYVEIRKSADSASIYPGFNADLANQPYFVIMQG